MSYSSTKSTADRLARGLADLQSPNVCPYCLDKFAERFDTKLDEHITRLRVDCHALFDACIATLSFPRTPEELERLALTLEDNRKCCTIHRVPCRSFKPEDHLDSLMSGSAEIFAMGVRLGESAFADRALKANKSFADKRGRWPSCIEQLFPNGVQATVETLLDYCELYISKGPLSMLTILILVVRPAIMPVLTLDRFRLRFVNIVLKMLDPVASGITARTPWMGKANRSHGLACHTTHVLGVLKNGAGALPNDCSRFFAGHQSELLRLLGHIVDRMEDNDNMLKTLAYCCTELSDHCGEPVPARVERWFASSGRCRCKKVTAQTVHWLAQMYRDRRVCAGPACALSVFQKEDAPGKPFPACARCRIPRYCSRACQLADWKGTPPHKDLCAVFCKLNARTFTAENLTDFKAAYQRAEPDFTDEDRQALATFVADNTGDCKHTPSPEDALEDVD